MENKIKKQIKFIKMQATGNDYIYIDCTENDIEEKSSIAKILSDRHFGIGGDGVVFIEKCKDNDAFMQMYNADGSEAGMCGNAIRCVAKYLRDYKNQSNSINIETKSGVKKIELSVVDGKTFAKVDMGQASFDKNSIPVVIEQENSNKVLDTTKDIAEKAGDIAKTAYKKISLFSKDTFNKITNKSTGVAKPVPSSMQFDEFKKDINVDCIDEIINCKQKFKVGEYFISCVSMGNPHCVIFVDDLESLDINKIGPIIENDKRFPNRTNVEFVKIIDDSNFKMRVWERGSGETLACGTGACAAVAVCCKLGHFRQNKNIKAELKGGVLDIVCTDESIFLTGEAVEVFSGVYNIN